MSLLSHQYAKAFFDLSVEKNMLNVCRDELSSVADIYAAEKDLQAFLMNPQIGRSNKTRVLETVFKEKLSPDTFHFLMLLLDKSRIRYLPEIAADFSKLYDRKENILNITITTAKPLEEKYVQLVSEKFKALYHASDTKVLLKTDPTLLGGLQVAIGDKLYDASLKEKLFRLRSGMRV